ncbi:MAG: AraC family transcriptional regulator [Bacteroidota bacterium]
MTSTFRGNLDAFFGLSTDYIEGREEYAAYPNLINILWNQQDEAIRIAIDQVPVVLQPNQLTTSTYLQYVDFSVGSPPLTAFSFNREFYCIIDHDHEVSCNGIIFLGTQEAPIVSLDATEQHKFELLLEVFKDEFQTRDNIQGEMLRMLLKRLIIKITRLARQQLMPKDLNDSQVDLVRKFNVLVELHFREKHQVGEYADLLFKSPKTLSNLFARHKQKSPLQIIHDRIVLEGKRLLLHTDKTAREIAFEIGFKDPASFHKMFKKHTSHTPKSFRKATVESN